jgi:FMN phosphatase YigB (HAD superfamily)
LRGRFDAELFSCEVGMVKPEAAIFRECLDRMGLAASECIYVGDGGGAMPQQNTEAWVSASALNMMTTLGMPVSVKI